LNLKDIEAFLARGGDYTVRLLNKRIAPPSRYIFALLWFNGNTGLWMARFLAQNMQPICEESKKEFQEARRILVHRLRDYMSKGYKVTAMQTGYYVPPWLVRKR